MKILAIETSCDETAIALIEASGGLRAPKFKIIKNEISSQIAVHRPFGGVVPNLAKREHIKNLPLVLRQVFANPKSEIRNSKQIPNSKSQLRNYLITQLQKIDLIAVTVGPGLEPALWTGIEFAKQLHSSLINADPSRLLATGQRQNADQRGNSLRTSASSQRKSAKPLLIGVNHMEGHLYSFLANRETVNSKHEARNSKQIQNSNSQNSKRFGFRHSNFEFPAVALLVSGGHTILLAMRSLTKWKKLGETRDDAAGEAFDKVARMLKLPYPGGPEISKLAAKGDPKAINFPRPMLNVPRKSALSPRESASAYDFSFSGLKTAVLYYLRDHKTQINADQRRSKSIRVNLRKHQHESADAADVAASFEQAIIDVLVKKTMRATQEYGAKSVILAGGVAANNLLRETLRLTSYDLGLNLLVPPKDLNTDNAAMIGIAAYIAHLQKKSYPLVADANLNL